MKEDDEQVRIRRRSGKLPHVGLGPPAGSMYSWPEGTTAGQIIDDLERPPIRVQASVGEPVRELRTPEGN